MDIDKPVKADLLPISEYFLDEYNTHSMESAKLIPDSDWTAFNRDQFRLGFLNGTLWVRSTVKTKGKEDRDLLVDLHGIIDNIQLRVSAPKTQTMDFIFGKGSETTHDHKIDRGKSLSDIGKKADTDHVQIKLSPEKTYEFLLKINGSNPVIGSYRIIEHSRLDSENRLRANAVVGYIFVVFLIIFYSSLIFVSTRDTAFIYHILYTLFASAYLLGTYSFIEAWFDITDLMVLQKIVTFSATAMLLSLLAFGRASMGDNFNACPKVIRLAYSAFFSGGLVTLCLIFILPYQDIARILIVEAVFAMVLAPLMAFYNPEQTKNMSAGGVDTKLLRLRITLLTFTFIGGIHVSVITGLVDVNWFTNYILFLLVFIEIILFITVIFLNIDNDKKALYKESYFNRHSQLPNDQSLRKHFLNNAKSESHTLLFFWVSGFDHLEIALGMVLNS